MLDPAGSRSTAATVPTARTEVFASQHATERRLCYCRGVHRFVVSILILVSLDATSTASTHDPPRPVSTGLSFSFGSMRLAGDGLPVSDPEDVQGFFFGSGVHLVVRRNFARYASVGWKTGLRTAGSAYTRSETLPGETEPVVRVGRYHVTYLETTPVFRAFTDTRIRFYGELAPGIRIVPGSLRSNESYRVDGESVDTNGRTEPSRRFAATLGAAIGIEYETSGIIVDGAFGFSILSQRHTVPPGSAGFVPQIIEMSLGFGYVW